MVSESLTAFWSGASQHRICSLATLVVGSMLNPTKLPNSGQTGRSHRGEGGRTEEGCLTFARGPAKVSVLR
jgi:hypothetical protein